jgi:hypothetical protein
LLRLLMFFLLGLALVAQSALADPIGKATITKNQVRGILGTDQRPINVGSDVFSDELVQTGSGSLARLVFLDNTDLAVGPQSEVRLDKFVYDPQGKTGDVVIHLSRGAFRFVTGTLPHRSYNIVTPYATLAVRGTVFDVVATNQKVDVLLKSGGVDAQVGNQSVSLDTTTNFMSAAADGTVQVQSLPPDTEILPFDVAAMSSDVITGSIGGGGPTGGGGPVSGGGGGTAATPGNAIAATPITTASNGVNTGGTTEPSNPISPQ